MLTPGFRLFFGFFFAAVAAAAVYGVASGSAGETEYFAVLNVETWVGVLSLGYKGGIGDHVGYAVLMGFAVLSALVALFLVVFRDTDAESVGELMDGGQIPQTQNDLEANYWPAVSALGVGAMIVGLVTHPTIFVIGLVIVGAAIFEWMLAAWADRATADPAINRNLRNRIMRPIEYPVTAALGVAVLVLALSRVLLTVSKFSAVIVAGAVATVIFFIAVAFAMAPRISRSVIVGTVALICVGVLVAGVITAAMGSRDFHPFHHESPASEHGESPLDHGEAK
ncbi:hypothetical protein [Candidatus Poriferisocius sp.]|uniref:hypothetical protein n=1 Tax=Candidatus Poriferisocius sp. TaxID=3101276 RepID=UPI003B01523E